MKFPIVASTFWLALSANAELRRAKKDRFQRMLRRRLTADANCVGQGRFQYIVTCKHGEEEACLVDLIEAGIELVHLMPGSDYFSVCADSIEEIEKVKELTEVQDLEPDPTRTIEDVAQSSLRRKLSTQKVPYGVNLVMAPEFWSEYEKRGAGVTVCVVDSGLKVDHEDIKNGNINGTNDKDIVQPWNEDDSGHGTHVTGTIAAVDNDVGVVGVSPESKIHVVRVFEGEAGVFGASSLIDAMLDCEEIGADIINMSLGGPHRSTPEQVEITRLLNKGILIVAAAGNSADVGNTIGYPAAYDGTMSVGAVDESKHIASFSTFNDQVDVGAPGVKVLSISVESTASYVDKYGTSMAAPHVAGVAALLKSQFPDKSGRDIRTAIELSAEDVGACGKDPLYGHGIVNAMAAAKYLQGTSGNAPEQNGCADISIRIKTDKKGSETTYKVIKKSTNEIVFRGGPYADDQELSITDNYKVANGCYHFMILDFECDGTNDPQLGIGEYKVIYNGNQQVDITNFTGCEKVAAFGDCGGNSEGTTGGTTDEGQTSGTCTNNPPGWLDEYKDDCEWYAKGNNCQDYGNIYAMNGVTANMACCVCGGGSTTPKDCTNSPSDWHDVEGEQFDCGWYAEGTNCEDHGDDYANNGVTANMACCACGGGKTI